MSKSQILENAKNLISQACTENLSNEERGKRAVGLASLLLQEAFALQTNHDKKMQKQVAGMLNDKFGKAFTGQVTDQCFRSESKPRSADQLSYLISKYGPPSFLDWKKRLQIKAFGAFGKQFSILGVPLAQKMLRKEVSDVILPGENKQLIKHIKKRQAAGLEINLNRLGEAILGEDQAERRLKKYLEDLSNPQIEYISIKLSTIFSQLDCLSWKENIPVLISRLSQLYRQAETHTFLDKDGSKRPKFINLDMEEYQDLHLTVDLFQKVLEQSEFLHHHAGIVLQAYLPEAFSVQKKLTTWAMKRVSAGGAPIKIRIVKGANLAMEKLESSLFGRKQAPYNTKIEVDANFKRMLNYGCQKKHALAVHLGIGSHNLFDIAYTFLLRAEHELENELSFEMLEGMAMHIRRAVHKLSNSLLLYCPAATHNEFPNAIAYLIRRLEENTSPQNFLCQMFSIRPGNEAWNEQAELFLQSCAAIDSVSSESNRQDIRQNVSSGDNSHAHFSNEPDTDWSIKENQDWIFKLLLRQERLKPVSIPLIIGEKKFTPKPENSTHGVDPSQPDLELYRYRLANDDEIDQALDVAKAAEMKWTKTAVQQRSMILARVAQIMRERRGKLIGVMLADGGKTVREADSEISEAIDFIEYYRRNVSDWIRLKDVNWEAKGSVLVTPPWNFPLAIPCGGIAAALITGNCVLLKPAPETVLVAWSLVKIFWDAGIEKDVLQFIPCLDEPTGTKLIKDTRINSVILTGGTLTAHYFLQIRPSLNLLAETGGKNALIITALADRDLAIIDAVKSAFLHAGQKCSACSLLILEKELYDSPKFLDHLRDAAASLAVGPAWKLSTQVPPLIIAPSENLYRGLTQLDEGEEWLLKPQESEDYPNLWSPGIKLNVMEGSFSHLNEFFGPVLSVMRAENLEHAIELANGTVYGLTSGLHSLDEREHKLWLEKIETGNAYINRTITGAIVRRQPFGGCKSSSFGPGAKAGGPNYLSQLMKPKQLCFPKDMASIPDELKILSALLTDLNLPSEHIELFMSSVGSYAHAWNEEFSKSHDPSMIRGQDNKFRYVPHMHVVLRLQKYTLLINVLRVLASAIICKAPLTISTSSKLMTLLRVKEWKACYPQLTIIEEEEDKFIQSITNSKSKKRLRMLQDADLSLLTAIAGSCDLIMGTPLANGRIELLHMLREMSVSHDYHRYGNLGEREDVIASEDLSQEKIQTEESKLASI
jgi:RHH-type proline utilization regulon transcriptional repressor/proline dehydrogenase/delta 1-pyrroline-5-carboxylate dehydrogenase